MVDKDIKLEPGEKLCEKVLANTENIWPIIHGRICIAKVYAYDYDEVR